MGHELPFGSQMAYCGLDEDLQSALRSAKKFVMAEIDPILDDFYAHLAQSPGHAIPFQEPRAHAGRQTGAVGPLGLDRRRPFQRDLCDIGGEDRRNTLSHRSRASRVCRSLLPHHLLPRRSGCAAVSIRPLLGPIPTLGARLSFRRPSSGPPCTT